MVNSFSIMDLHNLDKILQHQSYIEGYTLSESDFQTFNNIPKNEVSTNLPNLLRWYTHICSFLSEKVKNSPQDNVSTFNVKPLKKKTENIKFSVTQEKEAVKEVNSVKGELTQWPAFIEERLQIFEKLKQQSDEILSQKTSLPIKVTLPDGSVKEAESWKTTPFDIAQGISKGLAEAAVVAKVNGVVWDLERPFEEDSSLELLKFDNDEAKTVFWHSTAHVLGEAMERVYGGHLCYGPPIEEGFYYDMYCDTQSVSNSDFPVLEDVMKKIVKEGQKFERLEIRKEDLLEMFKYNKFKVRILNEKVKTPTTTVYRCGPLIDLCRGPHVRHTGKIKSIMVTKNSASYWEGKSDAESLQRVYGISFPDPKQLREWKHFQEEAAKRDHRKLGVEQKLYFFNELSPGSCFFSPRGAYIYNALLDFIRSEYRKRGFQEVISPNIYKTKLWQQSGHWDHYSENIFSFDAEKEKFALKPMNCPGHCIMFGNTIRSWRELPLRMADFGVLHRNEYSGALTGLTRVRRFQQDDAHIFCTPELIKTEIKGALEFLSHVYETFGFEYQLRLSTRPEKFMGDIDLWNKAEGQLKESLNEFGKDWSLNPGDGAFYGPKIDITVTDALRRQHQCATVQLDFQLPIRFDLNYVSESGEKKRPVIIHRAILGSVERMIAVLTESYGGKWPFWLSPRQGMVVPVVTPFDDYAKSVRDTLYEAGFEVDVNLDSGETLNKKIRNAQLEQYNFIFVVGEKEKEHGTVNVRTRDNKVHGEHTVSDVISKLKVLKEQRVIKWEESF
ncbi:Threonine--tRNA ligase, cytoplasmic [Armadillidium nasatum]|uniref:threonine--tRNA ligase n=1 Tax=Armadillidium nasatum TaxID=96803 RepID=A0A5N5T077_9CRUS|nr:Threonine--tRNA ligase, cytoplasmic [Armadillidium nasatum]